MDLFVQNMIPNFLRFPEEVHKNAQSSQGFDQHCLLNSRQPQRRLGLHESDSLLPGLEDQYHAVHGLGVASCKSFIPIIYLYIIFA